MDRARGRFQILYKKQAAGIKLSAEINRTITGQKKLQKKKQRERKLYNACHDHLTGLYNSGYLFEQTRELPDRNPETQYPVIYTDVNDFRMINDICGFSFGDFALQELAKWISMDMPEGDFESAYCKAG